MTHIKELRLRNWRCFRGEQLIALKPLTYAVVAQDTANPDRSNWLGKSSLLEAIRFALTDQLQKNEGVSAWISDGEREGGVDLELSDGAYVSRGRAPGESTKLLYITPDGRELMGAEAEAALARYFDPSLFDMSYFVAQDETSRLITMGSAARTATVLGWIGLDRVEVALDSLSADATAANTRLQQALVKLTAATTLANGLANCEADHSAATFQFQEARDAVDAARGTETVWLQWQQEQRDGLKGRELKAERDNLKAALNAPTKQQPLASGVLEQRSEEASKALADVRRLSVLAAGLFDGKCPVDSSVSCPARDKINGNRARNKQELAQAETVADAARQAYRQAKDQDTAYQTEERNRTHTTAMLESLERQIAALPKPMFRQEPERVANMAELLDAMNAASSAMGATASQLKRAREAAEQLPGIDREVAAARVDVANHAAAAMVLGRGGVQRLMAEQSLGEIERHANGAFTAAGVSLSLDVSWARETAKLEVHCHQCGGHYGNGQREKRCAACGATRAPALAFDLAINLSDRSGGARDLAGLVFQLSAARWLRLRRQWAWATYMIDEPFGAVDRANRTALAARLHSMMEQEFGAQQALVVAHDVDTLESLPARIQITSMGRRHSKIEVVGG